MSAIYDSLRDRAVAFISSDPPEIWALSFATSTWSQLAPTGTPPTTRHGTAAIYDPVRDRMLVHGGDMGGNFMSDETWAINFAGVASWTQLLPAGGPPAGRDAHVAIYDSGRDEMVRSATGATRGSSTSVRTRGRRSSRPPTCPPITTRCPASTTRRADAC
jgi:hypothetical protein